MIAYLCFSLINVSISINTDYDIVDNDDEWQTHCKRFASEIVAISHPRTYLGCTCEAFVYFSLGQPNLCIML